MSHKTQNLRATLTRDEIDSIKLIQLALEKRLGMTKVSQTAVIRYGISLALKAEKVNRTTKS